MENNIEKAKFVSQYWGQRIAQRKDFPADKATINEFIQLGHENWILELKPLSSITEEQVKILNYPTWIEFIAFNEDSKYLTSPIADKLREWGFAVDWNGVSVEEQVSRGWVKFVGIPEGLYIDKNTLK